MSTVASRVPAKVDLSAPPDLLPNWLGAMRQGDFEAAWRQTDRVEHPRRIAEALGLLQHQAHHLIWDGSPFDDRVVLVRCNHGLGDTLQFVRYLTRLRQRARQVILKVQPDLLDLLAGIAGADLVINAWTEEQDPFHDVSIECMEFPYAFRDTVQTIPQRVPYLSLKDICDRASCVVPTSEKLKVGLLWAASTWDDTRSIPLESLQPLTGVPHAEFYSLQQGEQRAAEKTSPLPLIPLSEQTGRVVDAAAAMLQLDLVLTVDSMAAHLAGALGCPVWVLLKYDADWRWMQERSDSPWYPSMRLFRQQRVGDWSPVVNNLVDALRHHCGLARNPTR